MIRTGEYRAAALRAVAIVGLVLVFAAPRAAAAQAAPPPDLLKLGAAVPTVILIQIKADKTAEFEAAWSALRAGLAKSTKDDVKAFGESLNSLYKIDQPPLEGGIALYMLQIEKPSTTITYNPFAIVYEQLWNADEKLSLITRAEADAIFEKLKAAFHNINPPWPLKKIG